MGCICSRRRPPRIAHADLARITVGGGLKVRLLTRNDEATAVDCMTQSFATEPMQCWVLGDGQQDAAEKEAGHRYFMRFAFLQAVHYNGVILGFDDAQGLAAVPVKICRSNALGIAQLHGPDPHSRVVLCGFFDRAIVFPPGAAIEAGGCGELRMALRIICCALGCAMPPTENKGRYGRWPAKRLGALTRGQKALAALTRPLNGRYWKLEVLAARRDSADHFFRSNALALHSYGPDPHSC